MRGVNLKGFHLLAVLGLVSALLLAACGQASQPAPQSKPAAEAKSGTEAKPAEKPKTEAKATEKPKTEAPKPTQAPAKSAAAPAKASAQPAKIRLAIMKGQQMFPIMVMEELGLAKKYGFVLEQKAAASPDAINVLIISKDVDVALNAWPEAIRFRAKGVNILNVYPLARFINMVLVKNESPLKTLEDVKGKKLGTFYAPTSVTSAIFRVAGLKYYGFDPYKDTNLQQAAKPLLIGLMDKGEVDAIYLSEPEVSQMLATGKYRALAQIRDIYDTKAGGADVPLQLVVQMQQEFTEKNPETAKAFVAAFQESVRYIKNNPNVWKKLAAEVNISDPKAADLLRDSVGWSYVAKPWDDNYLKQQVQFVKDARAILGPDWMPEGDYMETFSSKFLPAP